MLSFFPTPYPDEILCSVFARYHIRSANTSSKATLRELFNSPSITVRADLPYKLTSLIENLPLFSKYTIEGLIQKHTSYPMYAVFLPERREALWRYMKGELRTDRCIRITSRFNEPRYFRFCYLCLQEDLQKYGEAYWHRLHQIPGVLVCPVHTVALSDSTALISDKNWHEVAAASLENCPLGIPQKFFSEQTLQKLLLLAKDIQWLMDRNLSDLLSKELDYFHTQYVALLINKGLSKKERWIYMQDIIDSFVNFYGEDFLKILEINISSEKSSLWGIIKSLPSLFDPVTHLLMIRFLANSIEDFFTTNWKYNPFGERPWPCLNPASVHYLKPVVTKLVMHPFDNWGSPHPHIDISAGTFSCCCGFVYSRNGPDKTEQDKFRFDFINSYGQIWEQKLFQYTPYYKQKLEKFAQRFIFSSGSNNTLDRLIRLEALWQLLKI